MKKFNEYSSFEDKLLDTLKKNPSDLMTLSHKLKEDILPVSKVEMRNEKWYCKNNKK